MFDEVKFTDKTMKQVSVLVGAGSIGQAIIRRVSAGKHIVLPPLTQSHQVSSSRHWPTMNCMAPARKAI